MGWRVVPGTPTRRRVRRPFAPHLRVPSSMRVVEGGDVIDLPMIAVLPESRRGRTVALEGELTRATCDALTDLLLLAPPPGTVMLIDLAPVSFVDLPGARALLSTYDTLRCRGVRVVLCEPSHTLLRLFEVMDVEPPVEVTWR
jgi:anti-anti-sigma factor